MSDPGHMSIADMEAVVRWHKWRIACLEYEMSVLGRPPMFYAIREDSLNEFRAELESSENYMAALVAHRDGVS